MSEPVMTNVTRILAAIEQGDPKAANQLLPLVYDELRRLAAQRLAHEAPGQTLDATALVHEARSEPLDLARRKPPAAASVPTSFSSCWAKAAWAPSGWPNRKNRLNAASP